MTLCSWFALLDAPSSKLVDEGLERAFVSFATARALNAAISFGQGTEVAIQPMAVGVTLTPGQLLDPVNDLVKNFFSLMMAACIALGAQKMLINIGGHWLVSLLLTMAVLAWSWLVLKIGWMRLTDFCPRLKKLLMWNYIIRNCSKPQSNGRNISLI